MVVLRRRRQRGDAQPLRCDQPRPGRHDRTTHSDAVYADGQPVPNPLRYSDVRVYSSLLSDTRILARANAARTPWSGETSGQWIGRLADIARDQRHRPPLRRRRHLNACGARRDRRGAAADASRRGVRGRRPLRPRRRAPPVPVPARPAHRPDGHGHLRRRRHRRAEYADLAARDDDALVENQATVVRRGGSPRHGRRPDQPGRQRAHGQPRRHGAPAPHGRGVGRLRRLASVASCRCATAHPRHRPRRSPLHRPDRPLRQSGTRRPLSASSAERPAGRRPTSRRTSRASSTISTSGRLECGT